MKLIPAGKISSAHGIKGDLKLFSYLESPENFRLYKNFYNKDGEKIKFTFLRTQQNFAIIRLENINDRTAAEKIKGTEFFLNREEMPETKKGEYYYEDLIGLKVLASDKKIGQIRSINNYGAGEIIEIEYYDTQKKNELFAFTKTTFPEINIKEGYIVFEEPEVVMA